jgi:hypothetical protein
MHEPNLEKLRRFSLTVGLVTLTYAVAGISLKPDANISVIGLTFEVIRPALLPAGIVIASLYGTVRFYYYGIMLRESPYRVRRGVLDQLDCVEQPHVYKKKIPVYFGPSKFETKLSASDPQAIEKYIDSFPDVFPRFAKVAPSIQRHHEYASTMKGETCVIYSAKVTIPKICRLAAAIHDIDYSLPIWLNIVSLSTFLYCLWA